MNSARFDNRFVRALPGDPESGNFRRQVLGACYSRVHPTPVRAPRVLAIAPEVAALLDFDPGFTGSPQFAAIFGGNALLPGMEPHAMCYGGHQFGHWAGQLGDGRAIILGELLNGRNERWALQLKGAGPTPYSRTADGLAVLRSSVREFLCSEAMHHLGVPTTRALSLVMTGEEVVRDMFYDGNPRTEPGAVVCRVAPSFLRFGNYEILAARGDLALLRQLVDYTIATHFPEIAGDDRERVLAWLAEICRRTAVMVAHWMRVGFVHGVMNTDNMSVLGLTIDYGPYGWLEDYDPDWTPNTTDAAHRRYRYGTQPQVALWNLVQLANALYPLVEDVPALETALATYTAVYADTWQGMLADKLGLGHLEPGLDTAFTDDLFGVLQRASMDMTHFFRGLSDPRFAATANDAALWSLLAPACYAPATVDAAPARDLIAWVRRWMVRRDAVDTPIERRRACMDAVNPAFVLRNYLAQLAIDAAEGGDPSRITELMETLRTPYTAQPARAHLAAMRPEWARHRAGCSMLSCSS